MRSDSGHKLGAAAWLAWLPLLAGGIAAAWLLARRTRRPLPDPQSREDRAHSAERLCAAIIGNDKAAVASVFGPPRASAGFAALAPAMLVSSDYLHADTWYYPLDRGKQAALVVQFSNGIAQAAEFVRVSLPGQRT